MAKTAFLELLDSPKLISRKIWETEKSWNFHTEEFWKYFHGFFLLFSLRMESQNCCASHFGTLSSSWQIRINWRTFDFTIISNWGFTPTSHKSTGDIQTKFFQLQVRFFMIIFTKKKDFDLWQKKWKKKSREISTLHHASSTWPNAGLGKELKIEIRSSVSLHHILLHTGCTISKESEINVCSIKTVHIWPHVG